MSACCVVLPNFIIPTDSTVCAYSQFALGLAPRRFISERAIRLAHSIGATEPVLSAAIPVELTIIKQRLIRMSIRFSIRESMTRY